MTILLTLAAVALAPPDVLPPVAVSNGPVLVDFVWTGVTCAGVEQVPTRAVRPRVVAAQIFAPPGLAPVTLSFRISADGRPLSIGDPVRRGGRQPVAYIPTDDLPATLAGWQFAPGSERAGCTVTFTPGATPIAQAPLALIRRYAGLPRTPWTGWNEAMQRLRTLEKGCNTPRPLRPLLRGYPDLDAIPQPAGTMAYTVTGFDVDGNGKPTAVRALEGDGNAALDRAAREAVAKSRFTKGARVACSTSFFLNASETLAPPTVPEKDTLRPADATCPREISWATKPRLSYPEPFNRRKIEGWALIGFDVAPWGQLGNVRVLASEPAAAFGEQARRIIQSATMQTSASGGTGCVERVVFRIAPKGSAEVPAEPTD